MTRAAAVLGAAFALAIGLAIGVRRPCLSSRTLVIRLPSRDVPFEIGPQ